MISKPALLSVIGVALILVLSLGVVSAQGLKNLFKPEQRYYGTGSWNADSLGNHRVVLKVQKKSGAVFAHIPWRRRDVNPGQKNIFIIDASTGKRITNVKWIRTDREAGEVMFEPQTAPGEYYVYYLIYRSRGSANYPKGYYQPVDRTADDAWPQKIGLDNLAGTESRIRNLEEAALVQFQSIDEFNSFYPMEVIATSDEMGTLFEKNAQSSFLVFPEDRDHPIKMTADLPYRWIEKGAARKFEGSADRGEFYAFQVGLYALKSKIENVRVTMTDLKGPGGSRIPAASFSSFNTGGTDWRGKALVKTLVVEKGLVQALWMGFQVPESVRPGLYVGEVSVAPSGMKEEKIQLELKVTGSLAVAHGDDNPLKLGRLRWLDSKLAADDGIVPPFTPVKVMDNVVSCLGRDVTLTSTGFPQRISSHFSPEVTSLISAGRDILAGPIELAIEDAAGKLMSWKGKSLAFTKKSEGVAAWRAESQAGNFKVAMEGSLEFDGFADFEVTLTASEESAVTDIRLEVPLVADVAKYMMGLGAKGGLRPKQLDWKWNPKFNQDAIWIGDVNAGVQVSFRDENYVRPLNTNFYLLKPLAMPPSWYNDGKGGIRFNEEGGVLRLRATSGQRTVKTGQKLHFYFSLLITPFKVLDTDAQWSTRYYHKYTPINKIIETGANTVNVHHATEVNPYINYPFLRPDAMKAYADEAHSKGLRMKIYYTVRELSNRSPELFALRSLGDEVLSYGPGGGFSWLQEHLDTSYIAAWFVPELKDAAIINSGVSRWHNYYVEGLNWLVKNAGIDGIYIDDVAFDRTTMKRVRKVLDRNRPAALIDLHSANQFNPRDGFANSANLYLEHFPYINRLWFGEYFDYDFAPDFWLVEVSGIPFGLMGEMLEKGGNPWRGMIYGMTARLPWAGDPTPVWKLMDEFGMSKSMMKGYWSADCPVKTDNKSVLATVYQKEGRTLIALASWDPKPVICNLAIDWKALGLNPSKAVLRAHQAKDFQQERTFGPNDGIPIDPGKGWLLVLSEKP
ncbi:MAG: DUF6067 family protein [Ignavibacteriales bacterium]|nr:DUF6067 family protein [Ignavibacteriales bacterium]